MATVPIVTEVTKAELDALVAANGLNEGLQYKVTDKDWLLVATSNNTLISINNEIIISYLESKPDYISAKFLKIVFNEITATIDNLPNGGDPPINPALDFSVPLDYLFINAIIKNNAYAEMLQKPIINIGDSIVYSHDANDDAEVVYDGSTVLFLPIVNPIRRSTSLQSFFSCQRNEVGVGFLVLYFYFN